LKDSNRRKGIMTEKISVRLSGSESTVAEMASRILAARIAKGEATEDNMEAVIERSIRIAIALAKKTDALVRSEVEMA